MMKSVVLVTSMMMMILSKSIISQRTTNSSFWFADAKNMNGIYTIANPLSQSTTSFSTDYANTEYFDVYSGPIRSLYSQVHWRNHRPTKLPQEIVQRFHNKVMAIVGFEVDQVMSKTKKKKTTTTIGYNSEENDEEEEEEETEISVPITWAYNHHFIAVMTNSEKISSEQVELWMSQAHHGGLGGGGPDDSIAKDPETNNSFLHHHHKEQHEEEQQQHSPPIPYLHGFSEGNGGEFRMSYHGYPTGYAQLIYGPDTFQVAPMQIDTWNRTSHNDDDDDTFHPGGPLPKNSQIPTDAGYSGLIECPCSDRLEKRWGLTYKLMLSKEMEEPYCGGSDENDDPTNGSGAIANATECFSAAEQLIVARRYHHQTEHGSDPNVPLGCSVQLSVEGTLHVVWNEKRYLQSATLSGTTETKNALVAVAVGPVQVTVSLNDDESDQKVENSDDNDIVTITMEGPADAWFGVGFGTQTMCLHMEADECTSGGPYAIVVRSSGDNDHDDNDSDVMVEERKLDFHGPGRILSPSSMTVQSNTVHGANRTIIVTRPRKGLTSNHYTFDVGTHSTTSKKNRMQIPIIMARGCSETFAHHCEQASSQLNFIQTDTVSQICRDDIKGSIDGVAFPTYKSRCPPFPLSELARQDNPTCRVETYRGGLSCCRDGKFLLDQDQEIPWADQPLEYRLKFRFYFEEYTPSASVAPAAPLLTSEAGTVRPRVAERPSHQNLIRLYHMTEANAGEYDVPPCPPGTPLSACVHTLSSQFKVADMLRDCANQDDFWCTGIGSTVNTTRVALIYAAPHCHAPSCISMELYNADTGQLLCGMEPTFGQGRNDTKFDEDKFLLIPPCLWGEHDEGLPDPVWLHPNTNLLSVKRNNNTLPHTGEMASWQMRGVIVMENDDVAVKDNVDGEDRMIVQGHNENHRRQLGIRGRKTIRDRSLDQLNH